MKLSKGPRVQAPSSSLGIMRFFDADTAGPKIQPELVVGISIALIVIVLGLKMLLPL